MGRTEGIRKRLGELAGHNTSLTWVRERGGKEAGRNALDHWEVY